MDQTIQEFIASKRIAVIGVSQTATKFGNSVFRELKSKGYDVVPIHPFMERFENEVCFKSLQDVKPKVEAVLINVKKESVHAILDDANKANINKIWLQQGAESIESLEHAKSLGMDVVSGKCIMMYAEPVNSVHSFHRWIMRLLKKY